jgi:hypothetical protein
MFINIIFSSLCIAGIAIIWREVLMQNPNIKEWILRFIPFPFGKAITCGFCFTYWLSLFVVVCIDPLSGWLPPFRFPVYSFFVPFVQILSSWMIIGTIALTLRFLNIFIHEIIHFIIRKNKILNSNKN